MVGDGDSRFPPTMRLKKKSEFAEVFRKGVTWKGRYFSLHVLLRTERAPQETDGARQRDAGPRLGMVVPRSVGPAVKRNRIKRKIREGFRKTAQVLPDANLVIRPNRTCIEASEALITRSLKKAVKEAVDRVKERS